MAESSARRPGLLRRLLLCPLGLCPHLPNGDDKALWGECTICGRRAGEISREAVRRYAEMEERDRRISAGLPPACAAVPSLNALHPAFVEPVTVFMCRTDYEDELGAAAGGVAVYTSLSDLKSSRHCVSECGAVEVEIRLRRVIPEGEA